MELTYHINLDERGLFSADVRDIDGRTIWETQGFEIFEDGFMANKEDVSGLADYLRDLGLMGIHETLI